MNAFGPAIFLGALLLFAVQPMQGKYVLPWFGGGTAVWSACLLFFQVFLLAGYAYAHGSARWGHPRAQVTIHLALVLLAVLCLPVIPHPRWQPDAATDPTLGILLLLTATVGLPCLALAATGPLLQHWFSRVRPGESPYRLYALSNAGSLAALAAYPFLLEPLLSRNTQAHVWSAGLIAYAVLIAACAVKVWRAPTTPTSPAPGDVETSPAPGWGTKMLWLLLPACASALLLATTNKMCLDVAVIPFLWVLPLALYLLSFILSFAGPYRRWHAVAMLACLALAVGVLHHPPAEFPAQIPALAAALFACALVCHGELYRLRPAARYLTGYYLMIAAGGALGGVFVTVVAPLIFNNYFELHWSLALAPALVTVVFWHDNAAVKIWGRRRACWPATGLATILVTLALYGHALPAGYRSATALRNFYGVLILSETTMGDSHPALALSCGTTLHGAQMRHPALAEVPTGYYHSRTGVGLLLNSFPPGNARRIGVVGLGVGTLAAYGRTNDVIRFYEINPLSVRLAREQFSFLSRTPARVEVVLGDARLSLEREPPQEYDVLVLDAFNSHAVPVHLLTREVFREYERHVKPGGVIAVHISSRHLNFVPLLEALAGETGLEFALIQWATLALGELPGFVVQPWEDIDSEWFLLGRNVEFFRHQDIRGIITPPRRDARPMRAWTDDHASVLPLLKW